MHDTIGIIGFGNMGSAMAEQLKPHSRVCVFDKDKSKTRTAKDVTVTDTMAGVAEKSDLLILAVKPQDIDGVLKSLREHLKGKLLLSIAAGISTGHIERIAGQARVVRAMPNIGVKISESVTCLSKGAFASEEDLEAAQELFYYLGATRIIDENMMNAATAISGSGPAYVFYFLEDSDMDAVNVPEHARHDMIKRLAQAAEGTGFKHEDAMFLAVNTVNMSLSLIRKTRMSPAELRLQVTSKGGTTEAALAALRRSGSWGDAAGAALKRAEELARRD
ncbi:MAG: pyrroline-5-carboxylate reductase [Candidatus Omnitrophota bacterium]